MADLDADQILQIRSMFLTNVVLKNYEVLIEAIIIAFSESYPDLDAFYDILEENLPELLKTDLSGLSKLSTIFCMSPRQDSYRKVCAKIDDTVQFRASLGNAEMLSL